MKTEYILTRDNIRKLIKSLAALEDKTFLQLKLAVNQKYNKSDTPENLMNKLRKGTIKMTEILEIFEILGYDVVLRKR